MLGSIFDSHQLPLNIDKSWIMGTQVFSQAWHCALLRRRFNDGGKVLGVPIGEMDTCLSWLQAHFDENAPPERTLEKLQARIAVTLLKCAYNSRMVYLRKTLPEHFVDTGIFSRFDDKIDAAV